jgi:hypothetical protein
MIILVENTVMIKNCQYGMQKVTRVAEGKSVEQQSGNRLESRLDASGGAPSISLAVDGIWRRNSVGGSMTVFTTILSIATCQTDDHVEK